MNKHVSYMEIIKEDSTITNSLTGEPLWKKGAIVVYCIKCGLRVWPGEKEFETKICNEE